jgi:hypothetical protein
MRWTFGVLLSVTLTLSGCFKPSLNNPQRDISPTAKGSSPSQLEDLWSPTESQDQESANVTPIPQKEKVFDPDVLIVGQPNFHATAANNSSRPKQDTLSNPGQVLKVGSRYVVADTGNHRVLVFSDDGLAGNPVILGQPDEGNSLPNLGKSAPSARTLNGPRWLATDGTNLIVSDSLNHRVLIWTSLPTQNYQEADVVIGQPDMHSGSPNSGLEGTHKSGFNSPRGVLFVSGKLFIADDGNNRIIVFNGIPSESYAPADFVLGQPDFESSASNRGGGVGANGFFRPWAISSDGDHFLVSDVFNHRVLVWSDIPTDNSNLPHWVLGQSDFESNGNGTAETSFNLPIGTEIKGGKIYVADMGNNRLLYWDKAPDSHGAPAKGVIAQEDFSSGNANRGGGVEPHTLMSPYNVFIDEERLWVSDLGNHRILRFNSLPTESAAAADFVHGQKNFTSGNRNQIGINANGFSRPRGLTVTEKFLLVNDQQNDRVLVFDKKVPWKGAKAVIGQPDFISGLPNQGQEQPGSNTLRSNPSGWFGWTATAVDADGRLYIADRNNHRVLVYNSIPIENNASADYVIGQADFNSMTVSGEPNQKFNAPSSVSVTESQQLLVADWFHHRIMVFDLPITENHARAVNVIGQPDFETIAAGTSASRLRYPSHAQTDGQRLYVIDSYNNRVLVWDEVPTSLGVSANHVIGQPNFESIEKGTSSKRFTMSGAAGIVAWGLAFVDDYLLLPSLYDYRILAFDLKNLQTNMDASFVFGQRDMESRKFAPAGNEENTAWEHMLGPTSIVEDPDGQHLWISEDYGNRVYRVKKNVFWDYANQ